MRIFVLLAVLLGGFASAQPKPAAGPDPVSGSWRMADERVLKFRPDGSCAIWVEGDRFLEGKWVVDPFSEAIRRYAIEWVNGQTYDIELARDFSAIRGKNKTGTDISGARVDELTVFLRSNDRGVLCVNGIPIVNVPSAEARGRIFVKSGDVVTVELTRKQDVVSFALEIFKDNRSIISARHFAYSVAPDPDWKTSAKMFGFRLPLTRPLKDSSLGNVKDPLSVISQKEDEKFNKLHFKFIVR